MRLTPARANLHNGEIRCKLDKKGYLLKRSSLVESELVVASSFLYRS
jgi:hypothetical protein